MRALLPFLIFGSAVITLRDPLASWLYGYHAYDQEVMIEWLREARPFKTLADLPELARDYLELVDRQRHAKLDAVGSPEFGEPHRSQARRDP